MADEARGTAGDRVGSGEAPATVRPTPSDPARSQPGEAAIEKGVPQYEDPDTARQDIEATRARMSETIDGIEESLLRKRDRIQSRLDVMAPVRERPWPAMGIALGSGLLLGLLSGGERRDEEEIGPGRGLVSSKDWERRAAILDARTRRLVQIAREQEDELERLHADRAHRLEKEREPRTGIRGRLDSARDALEERDGTALTEFGEAILRQVTSYLRRAVRQLASTR